MIAILMLLAAWAAPQANPPPVRTAWSLLQDGVKDKSAGRRAKAVAALGLLAGNHGALRLVERALADPDADVRVAAANALGRMGESSARPKLKKALNDKAVKVVIAAANALYLLKDPAAFDVYYALLTGKRKSSAGLLQTQLDRLRDRKQLEIIAFETGIGFVPFGGMGYEAWKALTHDESIVVLVAAADKLAHDPDPKSAQALANSCVDSRWQVRAAVVEAIAERDDPALFDSAVALLYDENDTVRYNAAAAVVRLSRHRNKAAPAD